MKHSFLKDVGVISISQMIAGLAAFAYTIVAARMLGVTGYGLFQAVMALYATLSVFSLPIYLATVHAVGVASADDRRRVTGEFLKIVLIGGAGVSTIIFIVSPWLAATMYSSSLFPFIFIGFLLILRPLLTVFYGALQGQHRHTSFSVIKIVESLTCLVSGSVLIVLGKGTSGAVFGYVIAMATIILFFVWKGNLFQIGKGFAHIRSEFSSINKLILSFGAFMVIGNLPIIVGRVHLTAEMSGWFGALYNLRNVLFPFAFAIAVPFYTQTLSQRGEPKIIWKAMALASLLGGGFLAVALTLPEFVMELLYGEAFAPAGRYMALFGLSLYLEMMTMIFIFDLSAKKKIKIWILIAPACALSVMFVSTQLSITQLIVYQMLAWLFFLGGLVLTWCLSRSAQAPSAKRSP